MRKPLLFLPGPMQVPDVVRVAGDRPLFNHRSQQMLDLLAKLDAGCKPLFGTSGDVMFFASSGTGGMESAVVNLTSPGEEVVVIVGGVLWVVLTVVACAAILFERMCAFVRACFSRKQP